MARNHWLIDYENRRTNGFEGNSKTFLSSKFDLSSMSSDELRDTEIPELGEHNGKVMTFGTACSALKKSWSHLKRNRLQGNYHKKDLRFSII
jgi:hypothetical protein